MCCIVLHGLLAGCLRYTLVVVLQQSLGCVASAANDDGSSHLGAGAQPQPRGLPVVGVLSATTSPIDRSASVASEGDQQTSFVTLMQQLPLQRLLVWTCFLGTLYQLKDFTGVGIGTFVMTYVGNSLVQSFEQRLPQVNRRMLVVGWFAIIVLLLLAIGLLTVPRVIREGAYFIHRVQSENPYVMLSDKLRASLGDRFTEQIERFLVIVLSAEDSVAQGLAAGAAESGAASVHTQSRIALQRALQNYTGAIVDTTTALLAAVGRFSIQASISMTCSFIIVWDLPLISAGVRSLRTSRLAAVYNEIAPAVATFGKILGRALQAQLLIAISNTVLTALGMLALALPGIGFLTFFVFVCSFVPVAGVILSTVPMGFVALTEYGIFKLFMVIFLVFIIHAVEAYVLNPAIYSAHLKLHPLLTLAVLVFAEHTLGVVGLILAVPCAVFTIEYVINRTPFDRIEEEPSALRVAAK
eukprot:jgi/Chlat1/2401/Chrsp17S02657